MESNASYDASMQQDKPACSSALSVQIQDFGPISKADIALKPLTVFIGPNNSGKSCATRLVHSIVETEIDLLNPANQAYIGHKHDPNLREQIIEMAARSIDYFVIPSDTTSKLIKHTLLDLKNLALQNIQRSFSSRHKDLIRIGTKKSVLKINTNIASSRLSFSADQSRLAADPRPVLETKVIFNPNLAKTIGHDDRYVYVDTFSLPLAHTQAFLVQAILHGLQQHLQKNTLANSFYLPDDRSGILRNLRGLSAGALRTSDYAGLKNLDVSKLLSITADFIANFLHIPEKPGPFSDIADDIEEKILGCKIEIKPNKRQPVPSIVYNYGGKNIPLHRASSMVSELAPLVLYIRYAIKDKNSLLVIEEPESHLHPGSQRLLARMLARLVRRGLHVIITTHSPFILEQLSNLVMFGSASSPHKTNLTDLGENEYLAIDETAVYAFSRDGSAGITVSNVKVSEEGIPQEEFIKVSQEMYGESLKIQGYAIDDN